MSPASWLCRTGIKLRVSQAELSPFHAFVGVPVVLGANGVEKVVELDLNEEEKIALKASVDHVKQLVAKIDEAI